MPQVKAALPERITRAEPLIGSIDWTFSFHRMDFETWLRRGGTRPLAAVQPFVEFSSPPQASPSNSRARSSENVQLERYSTIFCAWRDLLPESKVSQKAQIPIHSALPVCYDMPCKICGLSRTILDVFF